MFSAILKAVTGYFDRQSILTTFFPLLLFWGIVIVVVSSHSVGWTGTLARWNGISGSAQVLLIVAFFSWAALWTFFTLTFRASLVRFFEGDVPDAGWPARLLARRRRHWERAVAGLEDRDAVLAARESFLWEEVRDWDAFPPDTPPIGPLPGPQQAAILAARWRQIKDGANDRGPDEALARLGRDVRDTSLAVASTADAGENAQLAGLVSLLQDETGRRIEQVRAERAILHYRLSHYFPQHAVLAPTRLGNAMRAMDSYGRTRYGLDLATIWPRLQPLLPADTLSWLAAGGVAFELMITLSALSAAFGVALGIYLAVIASSVPAAVLSAIVVAGSTALSWLCYRNAVEAAVSYGERVRSTLDLHRFRVLEAMRLPPPANLAAEEDRWRRLCGLLDRSAPGDPAAWEYTPARESDG